MKEGISGRSATNPQIGPQAPRSVRHEAGDPDQAAYGPWTVTDRRRGVLHKPACDPYRLRAEGLDRRLEPHEIGRALLHINQRRGFRSNRRADRKAKADEKGKIATGIAQLETEL